MWLINSFNTALTLVDFARGQRWSDLASADVVWVISGWMLLLLLLLSAPLSIQKVEPLTLLSSEWAQSIGANGMDTGRFGRYNLSSLHCRWLRRCDDVRLETVGNLRSIPRRRCLRLGWQLRWQWWSGCGRWSGIKVGLDTTGRGRWWGTRCGGVSSHIFSNSRGRFRFTETICNGGKPTAPVVQWTTRGQLRRSGRTRRQWRAVMTTKLATFCTGRRFLFNQAITRIGHYHWTCVPRLALVFLGAHIANGLGNSQLAMSG